MSKSDPNPSSSILITDTPENIRAKIRTALTDSEQGISFDPKRRPGVSNLLEILKHVSRSELTCEEHAADLRDLSMKSFKLHVADEVIKCLDGIRERFEILTKTKSGEQELWRVKADGRKRAMGKAGRVMQDVRVAIGLEQPLHIKIKDGGDAVVGSSNTQSQEEDHDLTSSKPEDSARRPYVGLDQAA